MTNTTDFRYTNLVVILPLCSVLLIWSVFYLELKLHINLNEYGIYPLKLEGLRGVLFSPFIHGSVEHLYNNTIPLAVLTAALSYFYRDMVFRVLLLGTILTGLLTWVIGRPSFHIGASGIIYLLASFIFFKGIFAKHYRLVALSLVVVFIYGSMLWYIFPIKEGVSWEGHLSGFLMGLIFALLLKGTLPLKKKYDWEREDYDEESDEFLQQFDDEGNFIGGRVGEQERNDIKIIHDWKEDESNKNRENI
ncbi:rhomboid family intramembrane serine protease [Euzebyella marina]|uniref:Rhomboid family intramembrane serine protease n=1 Tax=Euzebyella marina TaxID=1761453 RepID=A0A3G2L9U2_9FLAO|nr:rhomboid family intramembrane serine protease [Euzebyella marina]AYN69010.1 rhomboid family intramembrane serine protease [Euzebyella marina]